MDKENNLNEKNQGEINPAEIKPVEIIEEPKGFAQSELVVMLSGYLKKVIGNPVLRILVAKTILVAAIVLSVLFIFTFFLYIVPSLQEASFKMESKIKSNIELKDDPGYKKQITALSKEVQRLSRKYSNYTPGQSYLIINTTNNRFTLFKNKKPVREGLCSSGSYTRLSSSEGSRHWIFKTPKGQFWIQQKIVKPLWIRPDWAYVEEGLPIPPANDESRFEYGVLGDYAMYLGDGYLIHGTIYKRAMGMPVTHGCVRLGDDDLEVIFNTLNIGSKVFIF